VKKKDPTNSYKGFCEKNPPKSPYFEDIVFELPYLNNTLQ
jgi:hypothetical protein